MMLLLHMWKGEKATPRFTALHFIEPHVLHILQTEGRTFHQQDHNLLYGDTRLH